MASGTERHSSNVLEKFVITIKKEDLTLVQNEVSGYRISIPDCPDAKLFVHESHKKDGTWCVTEELTGFMLCTGASKPAAVGRARRKITENYDKFVIALKNAQDIRESGKAPADNEVKDMQEDMRPVKAAAKIKK